MEETSFQPYNNLKAKRALTVRLDRVLISVQSFHSPSKDLKKEMYLDLTLENAMPLNLEYF